MLFIFAGSHGAYLRPRLILCQMLYSPVTVLPPLYKHLVPRFATFGPKAALMDHGTLLGFRNQRRAITTPPRTPHAHAGPTCRLFAAGGQSPLRLSLRRCHLEIGVTRAPASRRGAAAEAIIRCRQKRLHDESKSRERACNFCRRRPTPRYTVTPADPSDCCSYPREPPRSGGATYIFRVPAAASPFYYHFDRILKLTLYIVFAERD
ncbi:hypothetical protein C8R43DRAFT_1140462 [Mycena crocata]|nr:hypothetical protein C8R43DRAFT_1140462 [Mycena crocata]